MITEIPLYVDERIAVCRWENSRALAEALVLCPPNIYDAPSLYVLAGNIFPLGTKPYLCGKIFKEIVMMKDLVQYIADQMARAGEETVKTYRNLETEK